MKKRKYLFMLITIALLTISTGVKADVYKEEWPSAVGKSCDTFTSELESTKTGYNFDESTGKFSLTGKTYKEAKNTDVIFYKVGKNNRMLYIYVLNYNKNAKLEEVKALNLPAFNCAKVYRTETKAYPINVNGVTKPYISSALASSVNYNTIKLTYKMKYETVKEDVSKAAYIIYKSNDNGKTYTKKLIDTTKESYTTTNSLTTGTKAYYKIVPYVIFKGEKRIGEEYYISITPKLNKPTNVKSSSVNYNTIKVTWSKVTGATGYTVYKYNEKTKSYSTVITNTKNLYVNTTYKNVTGQTSYYKVKAYRTINGKKVYSDYSSQTRVKPIPSTPTLKVTKYKKGVARVAWYKVKGASGYAVYRYNAKTKKYVYIKNTKSLYMLNTNLTKGKKYYYKVRAYKIVNNKKVYSNYSKVKSAYV